MTWRTCCDSREGYDHSDLCAAPSAQPPFTDRWDVATLKAERNRYREALEEIARDVFSDRESDRHEVRLHRPRRIGAGFVSAAGRDAAYLARLRLWLTMWLMPRGYALWEYGRYSDDGFDLMLLAKVLPEEGFELCRACHATGERSDGRSCSSCKGDGIVRVIA